MKYFGSLLLLILSMQLTADQRCDCTVQQGDCVAQVERSENFIEVTTNTQSCAEVIFYIDGYPHATLVTNGRNVIKPSPVPSAALNVGQCHLCKKIEVTAEQLIQASLACSEDLLKPTVKTEACVNQCSELKDKSARDQCGLSCQQYSQCLDKNCVERLRNKFKTCEKQCDWDMQSSMAADITVLDACMDQCKLIKGEIGSCPIL